MKLINLLILLVVLCLPHLADARNIQDNYKFAYNIVDSLGSHVSGQTVALKIQRASDGYFYDFSDSTFKNSGWTNKTTNLTEDATNGLYYYTFDPPASETSPQQYVFIIDNTDSTYGDHQSAVVSYQNIGTSTFSSTNSQIADAVWNNDVSSGYTGKAGETVRRIDQDTNGVKDGADYNGIEKVIRAQR